MKLSSALGVLIDIQQALSFALLPTLKRIISSPKLLLHPRELSRIFMSFVWVPMGEGIDSNASKIKQNLITENASGVVLDIGAGHGHSARYLDKSKVTKYIALEPNHYMHPRIRALASELGYSETDGTLQILGCGAEEAYRHLPQHSVDTVISILTLCTVPDAQLAVDTMTQEVLKPGGTFLLYEHVLSDREDVQRWQKFWSPIWGYFFDGCRLDCPSHRIVRDAGIWEEEKLWPQEGESEEHLFWHQIGRFVKKTT